MSAGPATNPAPADSASQVPLHESRYSRSSSIVAAATVANLTSATATAWLDHQPGCRSIR